ncbi:monocarboxylate transporter 5-like [Venturia canescens]|uniref:monocarboxylate transporter 5-like n=1 Tax=Venturia canescens TaxID=32260 RepID=UPI001C9CAFC1|nr:monocarboxylate transporter 5-like [Venturia canescens]
MSLGKRLRLDEVITSMPELGPTLPDGGFSWIVLVGVMAIQMTVPSISSMYGVVLGYMVRDDTPDFDMWTKKIALTPILFTAFWSIADPWTRIIVKLASVPRLIGLVGVSLLSVGVLASGYLASGGVGAYLAGMSAGAVMGIGASFVLVQSENVLRRHFRTRLRLALTLRSLALSAGLVLAPGFALALLSESGLHMGLLMMACVFTPTALGTMALRSPNLRSCSSPYSLLLSEEDNELTPRRNPNVARDSQPAETSVNSGDAIYEIAEEASAKGEDPPSLFSQGNNAFNYQDPDDDLDLFVAPALKSIHFTWKQEFQVFRSLKFWLGTAACLGARLGALFLWILLPSLTVTRIEDADLSDGASLSIVAGIGTLVPNAAAYWRPSTARWRSLAFGGSSWLGAFVLFGLSYNFSYPGLAILAFAGGVAVGGSAVSVESALQDTLGDQPARKAHTILSTLVGLAILLFSFIQSPSLCLQLAALSQCVGGAYWVIVPCLGSIRAR